MRMKSLMMTLAMTCIGTQVSAKALKNQVLLSIQRDLENKYDVKWPMSGGENRKSKQSDEKQKLVPVQKSAGQLKVEEMLAKNRQRIREQQQKRKKTTNDSSKDWVKQKARQMNRWQRERLTMIERWHLDRSRYERDIPHYKKALAKLPVQEKKIQEVKTAKPVASILVPGSFDRVSRDQGRRSTCAAFAAIRAIEIKLSQLGKREVDLSEQYFYWASKPDCQQSPCAREGSWPRLALVKSQRSPRPDIPLEKSCPYKPQVVAANRTHIPLTARCGVGQHQVVDFQKVETMAAIDQALRAGHPVIGGFKLDEDFFKNRGNIYHNPMAKKGRGKHASGHALLLVGKIPYPASMPKNQGQACYLVLNSWGEGWGQGGYACISDRWIAKQRYQVPFLAVTKVK